MKILIALLTAFLLFAQTVAETPSEIEGVWVPEIEKTIELLKANMDLSN